MILILDREEGLERNKAEALNRGCSSPTLFWWSWIDLDANNIALNVGDGNGLSEAELSQCVSEMPKEFE